MSSSSSSSSSAGPSHAIPVPNAVVEEEVDIFDVYSASACLTLDNPNQRNEYVYFEKPQASFLRLSSLFDENHIHEGKTISVLAVVVSYAMIKQSKGSHKYSFTFTIIDPYRSVPSMSVPVVWFFNHLDDIATAKLSQSERRNMPTNNPMEVYQMHVGDIVVLENVQSQVFHGFPQILAREERSRITVIRSKQAYDTGKLVDIRDTSHWKMIPASTEGPARPVLAKDRWSVKSYGKKLPISNSNLSTYFSKIVLKLTSWTEHHMKAISLADGTSVVHTNIDGLYQLLGVPLDVALDNPVSPTQSFATFYNEIPNPAPAIGNAPSDSLMPLKIYDAVFLILEVIYGEGDKPTELVVWDGSSRGLLTQGQPQTPLHPLIANVASEAVKIQEYTAVIENCLQAPLKYSNITIHPPAASSSSSSSNATVNNTAAILAQLHTNKTVGTSGNIENRGYLGVPLVLRGLEPSLNHFIGRCSAGQWVRIRSMSSPIIVLDPQQSHRDLYAKKAYYFIRNDTHITPLHPFQSDVVNLAVKYVQRLVNPMIPPPLPFPQQQAASSTVAATAMPAPDKRRTSNVNGDPYCPLEWVWAIPAPAAFSCFGRIMQWYPKQVKDFVKEKRLGDGRIQYTFMCSLRIIDGSSFMDVILYQEEAERFFGISTAQLFENQNQIQTQIEQRLQQARDESMVVDMYIKSYVIDAAQTNHSNKRKRSADSNSEKLKRLAVFNTKAPFAITA